MEEEKTKNKKFKKVILILLSLIGISITAVQLVLMFYIDPKLEDYISKKVTERSQDQYSLRFENISINIFTQEIKATNLYLTPIYKKTDKKRLRQDEVDLFIPEISAQGLNLWSAVIDRKIVVSSVHIEKPVAKVERNSQTDSNPFQYKKFPNYYRLLKGIFHSALIKDITIKDGNLELFRLLDLYENVASIKNFNIHIENLLLDSLTIKKDRGYLDLGEIEAQISAFSQRSPDSVYLLSVGSIEISSSRNTISAKDINVMPQIRTKEADLEKTIIYEVYVPEFTLTSLDVKKLYHDRQLSLSAVKIKSPSIKLMGNYLFESRGEDVDEVNFYPMVSEYLRSLHIEKIMLDDAHLDIVNTLKNFRLNLPTADLFLYGFKMNAFEAEKGDRLFYSDKVFVKSGKYDPIQIDSLNINQNLALRFDKPL